MTSTYQKVAFTAAGAALSLGVFSLTNLSSVEAATITIDFSDHGIGFFPSNFFQSEGVIFSQGSFVGYVQGDEALNSPIAGSFSQPITKLSAHVAPSLQGTANYTLSVFDAFSNLVGSVSREVTQDYGDPVNTGFGYFTLDLDNFLSPGTSFTLSNQFVRSSFPQNNFIPFSVSSIKFTTIIPSTTVPESSSGVGLLLFAAMGTGLALKKKLTSS